MGKHHRQFEQPTNTPTVALTGFTATIPGDIGIKHNTATDTRPMRYIAMSSLWYTSRTGERKEAAISSIVDDLTDEDLDSYRARGHIVEESEIASDESD